MDNEAFSALVKERTRKKTTKEIAREAVEEEFRRKKKRRRGKSGGSSSDSDDSSRHKKSSKREETPIRIEKKKKEEKNSNAVPKYRDRARERREGKNFDYAASEALLHGIAQAAAKEGGDETQLSKYLGGDEAHTHLVKGLDVTLARKVKNEMGKLVDRSLDLDSVLREAQREKESKTEENSHFLVKDKEEALRFIRTCDARSLSTSLGKSMLQHLRETFVDKAEKVNPTMQVAGPTSAGLAVQRSTLLFSVIADPGDFHRAWEIPQETTIAAADNEGDGDALAKSALLNRIEIAFTNHLNPPKGPPTGNVHASNKSEATTTATKPMDDHMEDDSDDDIFAGEGEYVPPSVGGPKAASSLGKGSIFSGLVDEKPLQDGNDATQEPTHMDKLRARFADSSQKRPLPNQQGDYGEDMDFDFGGNDEDDGKGKRRKEETTMAAREYGRRGKPPKEAFD